MGKPAIDSLDNRWMEQYLRAAGLKRLSPVWAKLEIVIGLAVATAGIKLLLGEGMFGDCRRRARRTGSLFGYGW